MKDGLEDDEKITLALRGVPLECCVKPSQRLTMSTSAHRFAIGPNTVCPDTQHHTAEDSVDVDHAV